MSSINIEMRNQLKIERVGARLLMLKSRKELTRADYGLCRSILDECDLLQTLASGSTKISTVLVASNNQVLSVMKEANCNLPKEWYILPVAITPRMTCFSSEMVRDVADEFGVLLRKLLNGVVTKYPDVISLGTTLHFDNSRFPGAMTWMLRYCPFITVPDRDIWLTCNLVKAYAVSDRFVTSSVEVKLTSAREGHDLNALVFDLKNELLAYHQGEVKIKWLLENCIKKLSRDEQVRSDP